MDIFHLLQFFQDQIKITFLKSIIFTNITKKFNEKHPDFLATKLEMSQDINNINWDIIIDPEKKDPNHSLENFEKALQPIIDKYIPLEKLKNAEHKRKYKPWITAGIRTSIKHRDKLLSSYTKEKNLSKKAKSFMNTKLNVTL